MIEDKENLCVGLKGSFPIPNHASAQEKVSKRNNQRSAFGRLLRDATNEIREEEDEKVAAKTQYIEAQELASEWMREERDRHFAAKLTKDEEAEYKSCKAIEVQAGERAALQVAMEERRRLQAEAQSKRETEKDDIEYAKRIVIEDVESEFEFTEKCKEDTVVAHKLQELLDDEMRAEEIHHAELAAAEARKIQMDELAAADEKIAREMESLFEQEIQLEQARQSESDFDIAQRVQMELDLRTKKAHLQQEKADAIISRKLQIKFQRQEHRDLKKKALLQSGLTFPDTKSIARQWGNAEAECEDVSDGICLSILLPHMRSLKVFVVGKKKIEIEASRMVYEGDAFANKDNCQYVAEFEIQGVTPVHILDEDLCYEYSSETGLLHVYVNRVQLADDDETPISFVNRIKEGITGLTRIFGSSKQEK